MDGNSSNIHDNPNISASNTPTNPTNAANPANWTIPMPSVPDAFKLPKIAPLDNMHKNEYLRWKYTLFLHLNWHQLRGFVNGSVTVPAPDADPDVHVAFLRNKIMAYTILRDSVHDFVMEVLEMGDGPFQTMVDCLFNSNYDVQYLWNAVHDFINPENVC